MRVLMIILVLIIVMAVPVAAMDFTAPAAPEQALKYLPDETADFGDGLRFVIKSALETVQPSITEALGVCISLITAGSPMPFSSLIHAPNRACLALTLPFLKSSRA